MTMSNGPEPDWNFGQTRKRGLSADRAMYDCIGNLPHPLSPRRLGENERMQPPAATLHQPLWTR